MILSIDQSTSATKALVWALDGKLLGRADVAHKQITNSQGWVEHDGMEILNNTYKAARLALLKANVEPELIQVIGISNQRETAICWDKLSGLPLYNAIVWQCGRAVDVVEDLRDTEAYIRKSTGLVLSPFFSAAKFAWMIKHIPEVVAAKKKGNLLCGTIDSWLLFKLTGEFKTDYSNASRTQLLDLQRLQWDNTLAEAFGLSVSCLPEICMSDSFFGTTDLGGVLPKAIPIHGVMGDSHGALFGNQCWEAYMAKVTYGTGSSVMMNVGDKCPCPSPTEGLAASVAWGINGKVDYVLEGNINYTGAVIKWLVDDIGLLNDSKSSGIIAQSITDTGGVYLVPAFTGLGAPYYNNEARAAFVGMNPTTKKAHLIRAAEECIAYQIRDVVEAINKCSGKSMQTIRADGGPTRDDFLMNFQAGILDIPIEISPTEELSGMGAAFCAAIAAGISDRSSLNQSRRKIEPDMDAGTRERLYYGWKKAVQIVERGGKVSI